MKSRDPRRFLKFRAITGEYVAGRVIRIDANLNEDGPDITVILP